jgi:glycosyltransferase involved in cell wall biosynthesis
MRILLTSDPELPVPPPLYGGVQRLVNSILKVLKDKGHTIGLVAHPDSTSPADYFLPWPGLESQQTWDTLRNTATLLSAVQQFQPDLIHRFSRLIYMLPLMQSSLPKIMTYGRQPASRPVYWSAKLAGHSLAFTACSQHIAQQGKAIAGDWHTIYNFVELDTYTFQPTVAKDAPLVFLSRIERIKGTHTAISVAKATHRRLLIAGNYSTEGEEGRYWKTEVEPHLGKDGIEYVGSVDDIQKNELLGQAAAMIVPIEWNEPFGIVFAESLACGTPVISCPTGSLPEIVRPGVDGYLVHNIAEAVAAVEKLPKIDRSNCRQRVEELFSAEVIVDQYEQLYQTLIK